MARIISGNLPSWVTGLLLGYFIPAEVEVKTKITLASYASNFDSHEGAGLQGVFNYPGFFPNFSVQVNVETLTSGASYNAFLFKAVGFYGMRIEVFDYDQKHFNDWAYPIERKNFGYMSFSVGNDVLHTQPIHFNLMIAQSVEVTTRAMMAAQSHDPNSLSVAAQSCCATRCEYTLYKPASIRFHVLPVFEAWEVSWFVDNESEGPNEGNCWLGDCDRLREKYGSTPPPVDDPCRDYWYSCFSE